jgi:hypothetical protein
MIISKLLGGLGNQMFQYATGYALAKNLNLPYRIDTILLSKYNRHNGYQFNEIFDYKFEIASYLELCSLLKFKTYFVVNESINKVNPYTFNSKKNIFREYSHNYINDFDKINTSCYISGYWQSEKYFKKYENDLRKIFEFKNSFSKLNKLHENEILNSNSVSIHVRRGDYISNTNASKYIGICELTYYKKAIEIISNKIDKPFYFIFSDDIEYVVNNFNFLENYRIINNNQGIESYNDMRLMSLCKYHIIANSSFSWWGAWLANNKNKLVIAPDKWFIGSKEIMKDIYCENWIKQ